MVVDNTRKVASNLGCNKTNNNNTGTNLVDVLIPEVIQVYILTRKCMAMCLILECFHS